MAGNAPDYTGTLDAAGHAFNVDPNLLRAVFHVESGGNWNSPDSSAGAEGGMQFMPATAAALGINPRNPVQAIYGAAKLLDQNLRQYGTPDRALMAYNAGNPSRWNNPETQAYPGKVLAAYRSLSSGLVQPYQVAAADTGTMSDAAPSPDAPPTQAAPQAPGNPMAGMSWDQFRAAVTGATAPKAAPAAASSDNIPTITVRPAASATQAPAPPSGAASGAAPTAPASTGQEAPVAGMSWDQFRSAVTGNAAPAGAAPQPAGPVGPDAGTDLLESGGAEGTPPSDADYPTGAQLKSAVKTGLTDFGGILDSIAHGLSFGLDRPLENATAAIVPWYPKGFLQQVNAARAAFAAEHPVLQAAGETIGAIPTYATGEGALRSVPVLAEGAGRIPAMARNAIVGGAANYGMSGGDTEAGIKGAAAGALVPLAFDALAGIVRGISAPIMARLSSSAPATTAVNQVARALARDQVSPEDLTSRLEELGPNAALVDAGGTNTRRLGETIANMPGPAAKQAEDFLESRSQGQASRLNTAVNVATGSPGDFYGTVAELTQQRAKDAAPKYAAAFGRSKVSPAIAAKLEPIVSDPIGQDALQRGMRVIELENLATGTPFNPADYGVTRGEGGKWQLQPGRTNLRLYDGVKRGLDDIVEGFRDGTTGRLNLDQYGRAVNDVRAAYVGRLRSIFPRYASALDAWAGPSRALDALSMGRQALTNDPEVTAKAIGNLAPADKQFFLAGVARALKDKVDSVQDGADATRRIFGNQLIRDRIAAAFDDPAAFDQFRKTVEQEATFAKTRNEVLKGSQTARRLAGQQEAGVDLATPAWHVATGNLGHAAGNLLRQGANMLSTPSEAQSNALAGLLFRPQTNGELLNALARARNPLLAPVAKQAAVLAAPRVNPLAYLP